MRTRKRLFWQLFPSYLLITLLSLLAVSWFAQDSLHDFFLEQIAADLEARARLLEQRVAVHLSPLQEAAIDRICKDNGQSSGTRITVILPSGKVIGDSEEDPQRMESHLYRPEIIAALNGQTGSAVRFSGTLRKDMMYVALPLWNQSEITSVLRTSIPVTAIDEELNIIRIRIAIGGFLIALLASIISLFISRRVVRPIEIIKQGAAKYAQGDLRHKLPVFDTEEVGGLARALNEMATQLDKRINTINQQRNEQEAVLASMIEGVMAIDNDERLLSINQAAARILKRDPRALEHLTIQEVIRNPDLHRFVKEALASREGIEWDIVLHEEGERTLHTRSTPLRDADNRQIGILVVLNDVTQLRRLENMRRDFAASVSHEIKTPLTAIKGFVETLQHNAIEDQAERQRFLGIIERHVNRLTAIVEDLMQLSRIEQQKETDLIFVRRDLKEVLDSAIAHCNGAAQQKNIRITFSGDPNTTALVDVTLLEQAFINLLDNAIKYSNNDSAVEINTVFEDEDVVIRFKDHGLGIAAEHLPRLFERFYRVDEARSRKMGGTGLGLAIVKHIIQSHKGRIAVQSRPGEGSTFSIILPKASQLASVIINNGLFKK